MTRWFDALNLRHKLIAMSLAVTAAALVASTIGLLALDAARYRRSRAEDTRLLSEVIANNTAAAVVFDDVVAAHETLASVYTGNLVTRACIYDAAGAFFAQNEKAGQRPCPVRPTALYSWRAVSALAPIVQKGEVVGTVYVERSLGDLAGRVAVSGVAATIVLLLAGVLALVVARQLQHVISEPITALAEAARGVGGDQGYSIPVIRAPRDETGELVAAFSGMLQRVRVARAELLASNRALQREVEDRRRMQAERENLLAREREAGRLKDEFLAAVSHELRTPLNVIMGWAQVLTSMRLTDPVVSKAVESLLRNAQAQNRVIEDLLDVSRITTGKLNLKLEAVDLRSVVESVLEVVGPAVSAKGLMLERRLPSSMALVSGDPDRLRQVVWNLLSNATKFTPAGGRITVTLEDAEGEYHLSVADSGIGMAPSFLPHVFERFRQADGSTTRMHGGLGLGLAIVKDLVELHGGSIRVESAGIGRGATFTVSLSRLADAALGALPPAPARRAPLPSLRGVRVLAVDDSPDTLEVLASTLAAAGADIHTAVSGEEAVRLWRDQPADVLLCDLAMPDLDGFAVLAAIRNLDAARGRVTPALAVTAHASEEFRRRSIRAGFNGHVSKPYDADDLLDTIASAVAGTDLIGPART